MERARTRTEIVGDLLSSALAEVEKSFPTVAGKEWGPGPEGETLYEDVGPGAKFRTLANRHYKELEKEMGIEKPQELYSGTSVTIAKD